jgi:hypothetical protein
MYRRAVWRDTDHAIDWLCGWRSNRLSDDLLIVDSRRSIAAGGAIVLGTTIDEVDRFGTDNVFHGIEFGLVDNLRYENLSIELSARLALGNTRARAAVDGSTTIRVPVPGGPPAVAVTPAGLLAQGTNIGVYDHDQFTWIPEVGFSVGYQLTSNMRAAIGYTFTYWGNVARAGDQIDGQLNLSQLEPAGLVGPARPAFAFADSSVWIQGISFGLDLGF